MRALLAALTTAKSNRHEAAAPLFVILLVTDILGYTNIFPFTKGLRQ